MSTSTNRSALLEALANQESAHASSSWPGLRGAHALEAVALRTARCLACSEAMPSPYRRGRNAVVTTPWPQRDTVTCSTALASSGRLRGHASCRVAVLSTLGGRHTPVRKVDPHVRATASTASRTTTRHNAPVVHPRASFSTFGDPCPAERSANNDQRRCSALPIPRCRFSPRRVHMAWSRVRDEPARMQRG